MNRDFSAVPRTSGVYIIDYCGWQYVGVSVNLRSRLSGHFAPLSGRPYMSSWLQRLWRLLHYKHPKDFDARPSWRDLENFASFVLQRCRVRLVVTDVPDTLLRDLEQLVIDAVKPALNGTPGGYVDRDYFKHRRKVSTSV